MLLYVYEGYIAAGLVDFDWHDGDKGCRLRPQRVRSVPLSRELYMVSAVNRDTAFSGMPLPIMHKLLSLQVSKRCG